MEKQKFSELLNENNIELQEGYIEIDEDSTILIIKNIEFDKCFKILSRLIFYYEEEQINFGSLLNGIVKIRFENCDFSELHFEQRLSKNFEIKESTTLNCLSIKNLKKDDNNYEIKIQSKLIEKILITDSELEGKFYLNTKTRNKKEKPNTETDNKKEKPKVKELVIKDSEFYGNFKLHNTTVENISLNNVDFNKNADFYRSEFLQKESNEICFNGINFKGLVLFGDTLFLKKLIFLYVTFEGYGHFKSAVIKKGIDLEYTNIQKEINFYGVEINDNVNTSQETYRIIKHQFEKLGNKIEANKYHALEIMQRKRSLPFYSPNKLVLTINQLTSNFNQWWLLPLFWIFVVSFLTSFYIHNETAVRLFENLEEINEIDIKNGIKKVLSYLSIINFDKKFMEEHIEAFVINKILLGYLYYQLIMSIRKDTRK